MEAKRQSIDHENLISELKMANQQIENSNIEF